MLVLVAVDEELRGAVVEAELGGMVAGEAEDTSLSVGVGSTTVCNRDGRGAAH